MEIQTRANDGALAFYDTLLEAYNQAYINRSIWKISFSLPTGERVRLVRNSETQNFELDMEIEEVLQSVKNNHK